MNFPDSKIILAQANKEGKSIIGGISETFHNTDILATPGDNLTGAQSIATIIGQIGAVAVAVLGVVALAYTVYAGYLWFDARGDQGKVEEAKKTLRNAIIGIILVLLAGFLVGFFLSSF